MSFFNLAAEIRLQIYSELLSQDDPITLMTNHHHPNDSRSIRVLCSRIHPALLRVCKLINQEATPILYSNNCFKFLDELAYCQQGPSNVSYFFQQIGANAGLLRQLRLADPILPLATSGSLVLSQTDREIVQLIQKYCTGLSELEIISDPPDHSIPIYDDDIDATANMLKALDEAGIRAMTSLDRVVIMHGWYNIDEDTRATRDRLMQKMPSKKWVVQLVQLPPRYWTSADDRVTFDNYDDCYAYDCETLSREVEQREDEQWEEEMQRRRNDPFWKNDSDYD